LPPLEYGKVMRMHVSRDAAVESADFGAVQIMAQSGGGDGSSSGRPGQGRRNILSIIGIALFGAVVGAIFFPMVTFFAAMIVAGLTSNCGPGDSGGCAMWAGSIAIASVPVWAAIMFALALYSGLKSR